VTVDKNDPLARLGQRIAHHLRQAEEHEAKAREARAKAVECTAKFNELVSTRTKVEKAGRKNRRQAPGSTTAGVAGVSGLVREWAQRLGRPFQLADAKAVMRQANPNVTDGPFYHLVAKGQIRRLSKRGWFVHPDYYVEGGDDVQGGESTDQATAH
jgi:hypothetical protein